MQRLKFSGELLVLTWVVAMTAGCPTAPPDAGPSPSPEPPVDGGAPEPSPDDGAFVDGGAPDGGVVEVDAGPGLESRPSNVTCVAPERPVVGANIALTRVFPSLAWPDAVELLQAPNDNTAFYVVRKSGVVERFANIEDPQSAEVYLDVTDRIYDVGGTDERGLLGMAFHPDFPTQPTLYLNSVRRLNNSFYSVISRVTVDNAGIPLLDQEETLLVLEQPASNHNGGDLKFGPDGYLYASFGDGGSSGDFFGNGQNTDTLHATIIRIDVDGPVSPGLAYGIPQGNPFVFGGGAPEIFAFGLRNVWRMSFDALTGDLWAADVGQDAFEEVNRIYNGGNYGWPVTEGLHCYNAATCDDAPFVAPEVEYPHALGRSVTGGHVYRGDGIAGLQGVYVFGDFVTGALFGAFIDPDEGGYKLLELGVANGSVSSFGEDQAGNLYVLEFQSGIYRLDAGGPPPTNPVPARLSQTGCVDENDPTRLSPGVIPYDLNVPFWSDGAVKERAFAIPDGTTITVDDAGDFDLPIGSVTMKTFYRDNVRLETRLMFRHDDGGWGGYVYRWRPDGSDADLLEAGVVDEGWNYPGRGTCLQCHTEVSGRTLGLEVPQLNRSITYPETGRRANQLFTLESVGMLSGAPVDETLRYPDPFGDAPLTDRAKTYLHVNCAVCHQPSGPVQARMDLRVDTPVSEMLLCNEDPHAGDLGIEGAKLIAGDDIERSILFQRVGRRDVQGMPPLASLVVDDAGQSLLGAWISSGVCDGLAPPPPPAGAGTCENPQVVDASPGFGSLEFSGDTFDQVDAAQGSCGTSTGGEWTFSITAASTTTICISTAGSDYDTFVHARTNCAEQATEVACNDDEDNENGIYTSRVQIDVGPVPTFVFVDGYDTTGQYVATIFEGACP